MPILTKQGRIIMAESIRLRGGHIAWGVGDGAWTTTIPPEDINATALMSEVGRRVATVDFVTPDDDGDIVLVNGKFSLSATPTNHLFFKTKFTYGDASSAVIRELAVFIGTTVDAGLPPGQEYFTPGEVTAQGRMLHLEHFPPIFRSIAIEETFGVVVTF